MDMTTEALTPEKLTELERLLEAATPGPWGDPVNISYGDFGWYVPDSPLGEVDDSEQGRTDLALATLAVNSLPALLAIARREERLREALKGLLAEVEWWEDSDTPYLIYAQMNVEAWREARAALTPEEGQAPE